MKNLLAQTKVSKKTLTIKDFYEITKHAVNVKVGEQLTPVCRRQALGYKIPQTVVRGYFVGNILWLYCTNGVLYAFDGKSFVNKLNCGNSVPTLAEIKVQGQDRVLVLTNSNATILGENNLSVSMPYGSEICIYNGRIFIASDNTLYFGKQYDFNNFSVQVGEYNFINLDKQDGQILKILDYDKALLIICEKAIYRLTISSDYEYELNKVYTDNLRIEKQSVCLVANTITFINYDKLCVYKNGSIKEISSLPNDYDIFVRDNACVGGGKYYLPVTSNVDNQDYIYVYDLIDGRECLIEANSFIICDGEYYFDNSNFNMGKITLEKDANLLGKWISKKLDFNSNDKKSLLSLAVYLDSDANLIVNGDFGKREYYLKKGYCKKFLNLYSHAFTIEINFKKADFKANNLQLEYTL